MSHVTTCETRIDDRSAIKAACKDLNLKFSENQIADLGYGNRIKSDIVITLPDGTQIGLIWDKSKKVYQIKADFYGGSLTKLLGGDLRKLKQQHALRKLERVARTNGMRVSKGKLDAKTGDIQLYLYE